MTQTGKTFDHFENAPGRRVGALAIVRDPYGSVLFAEKAEVKEQRAPYHHPGGCVEANEPILDGLVRAAKHKFGIDLTPGRLLAVHHMYEEDHGTHVSVEGINFIFDGGILKEGVQFEYGPNVKTHHWIAPAELDAIVAPYTAARTRAALRALAGGNVEVLAGHPQK